MTGELAGRVALVTGGGKGVGRAICRILARRGAHVVVNYFHSERSALATVEEITGFGGSAEPVKASVGRREAVAAMFAGVRDRHGGLDLLFNNAARGIGRIGALPDADWAKAVELNLHGTRWCVEEAVPLLRGRPGAAVVNVSAIGAGWVMPDYAAGGITKAAVEALTRYLAVELAPMGIRVNAASSGLIGSSTAAKFPGGDAALASTVVAATPLGRLATEEDLAELAVFLSSDRASFVTGQTVLADGGLTLASAALSAAQPASAAAAPVPANAVAVVGAGLAVPGASSPNEFWDLLCAPTAMFSEPGTRFPIENFWAADRTAPDRTYSRVAGYLHDFRPHPRLLAEEQEHGLTPDEATRWLRHSILQAADGVHTDDTNRCAVYVGAWPGGSQSLTERAVADAIATEAAADGIRAWLERRYPRARAGVPALPEEILEHAVAGLGGRAVEAMVVDTACSSSLYAVDLGVKALLAGTCDVAYCGGVEALDPTSAVMFAKLGGLAPDGRVRSFDTGAGGTLFSDGAGVVALKRYRDAVADGDQVLGILAGFGAAADGRGKSIAAPNPDGQRLTITRARAVNGIAAEDVDWVVAHATGTAAGDRAELSALSALAPERQYCTSNKSIVGHTGWAAGAVSLIHGLLALRHERIPAQYGLERPHDTGSLRIPVDAPVPFRARQDRPRTVGVSAFGFGGTNGHLLVTDTPGDLRSAPEERDGELVLVGWSAHLPGTPERAAVRAWLRGAPARHARTFPRPYPPPSPAEVRMPPSTIGAVDPCHLMAREVAARFVAENGELWADVRSTTGVLTAHSGLPHGLGAAAIRCYADDVLAGLREHDGPPAFTEAVARLRARHPACTEDTQPGVMPNVIGSRITSRYDLTGASITVSAGRDSALAALTIAGRYLRTGELDLALVLALDTTSSTSDSAEGAFLLALAEADTAARHGWPVLATLRPAEGQGSVTEQERDYTAAGAVVSLLRAVETGAVVDLLPNGPLATGLHVASATRRRTVTRYRRGLVRSHPTTGPVAADAESLYLIADNSLADLLTGTILTTDPDGVRPGSHLVSDVDDPGELLAAVPMDVTVVVDLTGADRAWPIAPATALLRLHDLLLATMRRVVPRWDTGGSLAVLLCGQPAPTSDCVPHPYAALFTGFVRSLAWERPTSPVFALLTDATGADALAALRRERPQRRSTPVVWDLDGSRHTEMLVESPLPHGTVPVHDDMVMLATGGTGGLTVAMLHALARHARPHVWLLGRTDIAGTEAGATTPDARRDLIRRFTLEQPDTPVKEIVRQADAVLRARRVHDACDRLRRVFGTDRVHYLACDIRDPAATQSAVDTVLAEAGRVDVVLHAAGVFHPALVEAKALADFRAIRDTKVLGYLNVRSALASEPPSLWCNIGSAIGTYGMPGDTDYAGANDFLAAASALPTTGVRELTIGFPLWTDVGYGADPLNRDYLDRQGRFTAITPAEGSESFLVELAAGHTGESTYLGDRERAVLARSRPGYVAGTGYLREPAGEGRWRCRFDPASDGYLHDHLVDGKPTVPGTLMLEMAAEAAETIVPGGVTAGFLGARFESFIKPFSGKLPLDVTIAATRVDEHTVTVTLESDVTAPDGTVLRADRRHFRTEVVLAAASTEREPVRAIPHQAGTRRPVTDPYYRPDSPVRLSGIFANTSKALVGNGQARASWQPDLDGHALDARRTPFLLLCATARAVALPPVDQLRQAVYVPQAIARIDLYAPGTNDRDLTGAKIEVITTSESSCRAQTADGVVLADLSGLAMATMGHVELTSPRAGTREPATATS